MDRLVRAARAVLHGERVEPEFDNVNGATMAE